MKAHCSGSGDAPANRGTLMQGTIKLRQTENGDGEISAEHLSTLLRQVSKASMGEIESLIVELKTLHKKLETDGDRIQRDIAEHADLSQQVIQLTSILSDSVKKLPGRSR
jgi:predicted PilT family ATPase